MKRRKPKLTVAQHIELAQQMMATRYAINDVLAVLPRNSRHGRAAWAIYCKLDTVRSGLGSIVRDLTAGNDPRNLAPAVYYGMGLVLDPSADYKNPTADAFAGWRKATVTGSGDSGDSAAVAAVSE